MRALGLRTGGFGNIGRAGKRDNAPEHVDEGARQRQIGPAGVAGDVEQHDQALATAGGGHQRRTVGERRPGIVAERGVRFGQNLTGDGHVVRHRHAVECAFSRKGGKRLRLVPAQAAAENAAAAPQPDRNEIVIGRGEPRTGKAHQHAAILDPMRQPIMGIAGDGADIGENQHRQVLVEEMGHGICRRFPLGKPHVGEWAERALDVIARRQQRLRQVGGHPGYDADGPSPPALVEQLHGAGGAFAGNLDAGNIVADLDRQVELRLGLAIVGLEGEGRFAERQSLEVERARRAGRRGAGIGAQYLYAQRAGRIIGSGERMRPRDAALDKGDRMIAERLRERFDEVGAAADVRPVRQPHQIDVVDIGEELRNRGQRLGTIDRIGLRPHLVQADPRRFGGLERDVTGALRQRNERHGAAIVRGPGDDVVRGAQARVPAGGGSPAVVDQDADRRARIHRRRQRRMPQRTGGGDDDKSGQRQPHQGEPPRRAGGSFLAGGDLDQKPRRREVETARPRRNEPQQPPKHRQRQQANEDQRLGKADRQPADHGVALDNAIVCDGNPLSAPPMRVCSASKSSLAGRSVRWIAKLQPSRSVSLRISARWRATRAV